MSDKMNREECLQALIARASEEGRLPKKSDFTENEAARIKSFFGPWPRALEAAGLTPPKTEERLLKNREKRIRLKQKEIEAIRNHKK